MSKYIAIIETTLTDFHGKKKTFFPTKIVGLNDNQDPFLSLSGEYDDGTAWERKISKQAVMSIDMKKPLDEPETDTE